MLDWFRGQIPFLHQPLAAGVVLSVNPDGTLDWQNVRKTTVSNSWDDEMDKRGSHDTTLKIRSVGGDGKGTATDLQIDGNLAKFIQGHNVFGTEDLNSQLIHSFKKINSIIDFDANEFSFHAALKNIDRGDYLLNMIDINRMYDLFNDASVEAWLHAAEMKARSRSGRASRDKGTVYLQKNSRRWGLKFYNKLRELQAKGKTHRLPSSLQNIGLEDFARGKLRAELRLHSLELKDMGVTHGKHLNQEWIDRVFIDYLGRVEMNTQAALVDQDLLDLPRSLQGTYHLWKQGVCLKDILPKNTFYRHRRALLECHIDITCPPASVEHQNVIPMFKVLEAMPVSNPEWAYQNGLIVV
jgi:II/X family phage/plasmid replication protein